MHGLPIPITDDLSEPSQPVAAARAWRKWVLLAAGLAILVWSLFEMRLAGDARDGIVYLLVTTAIFLGMGNLALRLAGVRSGTLTWAGLRYITGYAVAAFLLSMMGATGLGNEALWVAAAIAAVGWVAAARDIVRGEGPPLSLLCGELFAGALLLRVALAGTRYLLVKGGTTTFTQYWDMLYHLAMVKEGIYRGMPFHAYTLEASSPRVAYHPAFDTMATVFIKTLHLNVDAAFFHIVLPVTLLALLVAIGVFAAAWARSHFAGVLALGLVAATLGLSGLPHAVRHIVGYSGTIAFRYFLYNPPSAVGAVGAMACLSLVALADDDHPARPWVLAGVIAGATALMKAPIAVVLVPAFALALLYRAMRQRSGAWLSAALGIVAALAAALAAYPVIMGRSGPPALGFGSLGKYLLVRGSFADYPQPLLAIANAARYKGTGPAIAYLIALLVLGLLGWSLVVLLLAWWRARAHGERPFARARTTTHMVAIMGVLIVVVGLLLVQQGVGETSSWNISYHTIQNTWWLGVCAAAVALGAALRRPRWLRPIVGDLVALAVIAGLLVVSLPAVTASRQVGQSKVPTDLLVLVQQLGSRVPVNAVIVQNFELEETNWVSSFGGRRVVLERAGWARDLFPTHTRDLVRDISGLYNTTNPAWARLLEREMGANYAIVNVYKAAPGLRAASTPFMRRGDWEVLKLEPR